MNWNDRFVRCFAVGTMALVVCGADGAQQPPIVATVFKARDAYVEYAGSTKPQPLLPKTQLHPGDIVGCKRGGDLVFKIGDTFIRPTDCTVPYPIPYAPQNAAPTSSFGEGARVGIYTATPTPNCGVGFVGFASYVVDSARTARMNPDCSCPESASGGIVCITNTATESISYVFVYRFSPDGRPLYSRQLLDPTQDIPPHQTAYFNFDDSAACEAIILAIFEDGKVARAVDNLCQKGIAPEIDIGEPQPSPSPH